ncbi:unnamed protein product [Pelagomonas calceolata]|uniref:Uncharacterized protein n=1 Tax=Pelagomonas calceolata TaxID=35677 RepID=A0A8J2X727_9STRA|nr:unnamed protein product [Pelagomonas calceolata]
MDFTKGEYKGTCRRIGVPITRQNNWTDESAPRLRLPNTRPLTFWGFGASTSTRISISIASPALKSGHGLWTFASASFWSWPSNAEALRAGGRVSMVDAQARCGRVAARGVAVAAARRSRGAARRRSMVRSDVSASVVMNRTNATHTELLARRELPRTMLKCGQNSSLAAVRH